jgi:hypothetical protein
MERKNRSIIDSARTMIRYQEFPIIMWKKTCNTTMYVQNRSLYKILKEKSPEEAFSGEKQDISHLRIFCCLICIHVPMKKRIKLEP